MKIIMQSKLMAYLLSIGFYLYYFLYRGTYSWCKLRPHYGVLSGRADNESEGLRLCIAERLYGTHWNFIHYGGILCIAVTAILIAKKAKPRTIYKTYIAAYVVYIIGLPLLRIVLAS